MCEQAISSEEGVRVRIQRPSRDRIRPGFIGSQRSEIEDSAKEYRQRSTPRIRLLRAPDSQSKITSLNSIRKILTSRVRVRVRVACPEGERVEGEEGVEGKGKGN
jgi:hypothetical protein